MRSRLAATVSGLAAVILVGTATATVSAAATLSTGSAGNGLSVSPLTTNLLLNPGQTQTVPIYVQNVTASTATVEVQINDFTAGNNDNGRPELLLNPGQYAPSHSLKRYIAPIGNISLQGEQEKQVDVSISIPAGTAGGGYYAAVRFIPVAVSGGKTITLTASIASLILVRVPGNVVDDLKISSFSVQQYASGNPQSIFFSNKNLMMAVGFNNQGNVQEQPFGKVILESGKKQLATYEINNTVPAGNVLPDSTRVFTVNLGHVGLLGKYTVEGNFGYGTNGQLLSSSTTFYVIPLAFVVIVVAVILLILFFVLVFPRMLRSYNSRVVRRARH